MQSERTKNNQGFTLIEIMVVVVIMGLLATLVAVNVLDNAEQAKRTKAKSDIKALESALELYKLDNGNYPTTQEGLKVLTQAPANGTRGAYIKSLPLDPWQKPYVYLSPGTHGDYDIISYGPDGEPGGTGKNADITSWDSDKKE